MSLFSSFSRDTTVADWAGSKKKPVKKIDIGEEENDWKDVHTNIERMDELYDAAFYAWLKSEENVLVTSIYLHRVANEYSLDRIINALEWLIKDWRWENSCILIRRVTVDWCDDHGHLKRAELLRRLTCNWNKQYTAALITTILTSSPYATSPTKREEFLRAFTKNWNFSVLSEFFMFLRSRANVDYRLKCIMLQEAARQDDLLLTGDNNIKKQQDTTTEKCVSNTQEVSDEEDGKLCCHRRATSNSYKDLKRFMMEEEGSSSATTTASQPQGNNNNISFGINRCFQYITPSSSTSSTSSATNSVVSPRYHHHHPTTTNNIRLGISSSSSTLNMSGPSPPSSNTSNDLFPSPSSSSADKKQ